MMDFFISYNKSDCQWAEWIALRLTEAGYTTILQAWDFQAGASFVLDMDRAIRGAERLIAVLSPDYLQALYTQPEWAAYYAADPTGEKGLLLPVRVRECQPGGLLRALAYVDLVGQEEEAAKAALLAGVRRQPVKPGTVSFPGGPQGDPRVLPSIRNVPPRNLCFTGRDQLLEQLHADLTQSGRAAISGLPGIGKTQSAIEYAHRYGDEYQAIFWTLAATRDGLIAGFGGIARLLDLPEKEEQDQNVIVAAVKRCLQDAADWLLILDNADDLAMVREFLPAGGQGHILMTTCASTLGAIAQPVEIDQMSAEEGACLLLRRAKLLGCGDGFEAALAEHREPALTIARKVGGLPLALDQAGAFIEATPSTPAEYLEFYETEGAALRAERGEGATHDHASVSTTFSLAFSQVAEASQAAADLLRLCAFLAPDDIPEEILIKGAPDLGEELGAAGRQPVLRSKVIQAARRFSALQRDPNTRTLAVHRLVQDVLKDNLDPQARRLWAERAVRAVSRTFPTAEFSNRSDSDRFLTQAQACADLVEQWSMGFPEAASLLHHAGNCLRDRGQYTRVARLYHQALEIRNQVLGPRHAMVAITLNDLAILCCCRGRYAEAELLLQQTLEMMKQTPEAEGPAVARTLNDLANLYRRQSRYSEAETLFRQALVIREQALGPGDPHVASTLNGLADLYDDQGRYDEAEPLYERALQIREATLGPEHPEVATSLNSLAILQRNQGRFEQAEALYQRALQIREQALGPEHPGVAASLNNLAGLYYDQGRYDEAEPLYQQALAILERVLGLEHPDVAAIVHGLAEINSKQGKPDQAEPLYRRALAIQEKTLGLEHLDVATIVHGLADLYAAQGRYPEAGPLAQRALSIREKLLVPGHSDSCETRVLLTTIQRAQDRCAA